MQRLHIIVKTGSDDLRGGSWANLYVKLRDLAPLQEFRKFTPPGGLGGGSTFEQWWDVAPLNHFTQIEFFQLEHVSQEGFLETADNWSMDWIDIQTFIAELGIDGSVGKHGFHRFDGDARLITFLR